VSAIRANLSHFGPAEARGMSNDHLKTFFPSPIQQSEFVRQNADRSNKTLLFLFAALTIRSGVAKSIIRPFVSVGRIAGFDGAACAAGKR
jgi:hypothetical protein